MLHESAILSWSEEKHGIQLNITTQIWSGRQSYRCHPVVGARDCRGMRVPCLGPTLLTDRAPANTSKIAAPLQTRPKWVDAVQTSLWICRPCVTRSDLRAASALFSLFPDGAGQVASSWVPLRDEGEERGAVSSFLPYRRQCPGSLQQSARAEHLLLPCPSEGEVFQGQVLALQWDHFSCTPYGAAGLQRTERDRKKSCLRYALFKDQIPWQYFYVLPSTSHKAEKVWPATSWVVLLWFFQTLSGWHWYRQWEEDISVALGIFSLR